jgi:signal transduction histidine kinase
MKDPGPNRSPDIRPGRIARWLVGLLLLLLVVADLLACREAARAPWIGARLRDRGEVVEVVALDPRGSAARAGIREGDTVLSACGEEAIPGRFLSDPDHIETWNELDDLVEFQGKCTGPGLEISWRSRSAIRTARLEPVPTGWRRSASHAAVLCLVAWLFVVVSWVTWLRRDGLATRVNLAGGIAACLGLSILSFYQSRDLSIDPSALRGWMMPLNYLGSQFTEYSAAVLVMVFPRPLPAVRRHRFLLWLPWTVFAIQCVLHFGRVLPNPVWTTYILCSGSLCLAVGLFGWRFLRERDALARSQYQWLALSFALGALPIVALTQVPLGLGMRPPVPESASILFTGLIPLGIGFAITRYRLLDIGTLVDGFLVHTGVLLSLAFVEALCWFELEPLLPSDAFGRRILFALAMLLVVFLYAPVRAWLARRLASALGRSRPSPDVAVEGLLDRSALLDDARQALEETLRWALRPESLRWIGPGEGRDAALETLAEARGSLGQELSGVSEAEAGSLWVPARREGRTSALVLSPEPGKGWRRSDLDLARLLVRSAEPLLEAQAMREEREQLQREMHDGLGNQLYGVSLLAQDDPSASEEGLRARMELIRGAAQEALDGLRTGLSLLSAPVGSLGPALASILLRAEGSLEGAGARLVAQVDDEVASLSLEGRQALAFLRSLQEALGNAARHSGATTVEVRVRLEGKVLRARVGDDGRGFRIDRPTAGLGLVHIRGRLSELGGAGRIHSAPGSGTLVELELPVSKGD